jgi:hypothetical protein
VTRHSLSLRNNGLPITVPREDQSKKRLGNSPRTSKLMIL